MKIFGIKTSKCYINKNFIILYLIASMSTQNNNKQ